MNGYWCLVCLFSFSAFLSVREVFGLLLFLLSATVCRMVCSIFVIVCVSRCFVFVAVVSCSVVVVGSPVVRSSCFVTMLMMS